MKTNRLKMAALAMSIAAFAPSLFAQLTIPSDGSDGVLNITSGTNIIDLSRAVTGTWSANNSANAGKGIYDSNQWAVVFKYSSVTIASGAVVTFTNHPSHAPVVWLVSGDVTINGDLGLDGQSVGHNAPQLAEPGPGGFRGGAGQFTGSVSASSGFGPGGGFTGNWSIGASYGSQGHDDANNWGLTPSATYGNPSLLPLIGGSGGAGYYYDTQGGGAGAGAILIASAGTLTISGAVHANGGSSLDGASGGSGGGIRLVANTLAGSGTVQCMGGICRDYGGLGRVRIERVVNNNTIQVTPDPSIVPLQAGNAPLIWLPTNGPTATIVSVGAVNAPTDPRASFGTYGPDVTLPQTTNTTVIVQTVNAESASQVLVRVSPRANGNYTETAATLIQTNSLNPLTLIWVANIPVNVGFSSLIARVIRP